MDVTLKAFYPSVLTVPVPVRSAYLTTLREGVGRSWAYYSFVKAYALEVLHPCGLRLTYAASYGIGDSQRSPFHPI